MPIDTVMVDRMRTSRLVKQPDPREEGRSKYVTEFGPWISCRVYTPTYMERREDEAYEYERQLSAMVSPEAEDGATVDLKKTDKVEIQSSLFQNGTWEIVGDPKPIRKVEDLVYWKLALRQHSH